jgi:hypothetical protein
MRGLSEAIEDHLDLEQGGAAAVGDELVQGAMHPDQKLKSIPCSTPVSLCHNQL